MDILENARQIQSYSTTIVFPAYNEASNLERAIDETVDFLSKICQDFEIIIVESGSTDNSADDDANN